MHNLNWSDYFDNDRECGGDDYVDVDSGNDAADADYLGLDYDGLDEDEV